MSAFSMGDAVGSGFGLISRRPLSVLAWRRMAIFVALRATGFREFGGGREPEHPAVF